jgi:hypothetical protein
MKFFLKLLGLIAVDFIVIWILVYQMNPDPSVSIGILLIVPFVFVVNLVIAGILFWLKKKEYSRLFLINSIIASIIMYYIFDKGIDRYQNNRLESWEFNISDTTFSLIRWKEVNEFSMSYSMNPGSSFGFLDGKCELISNDWILKTDSIQMKIQGDFLIGFRTKLDTIKMRKIK